MEGSSLVRPVTHHGMDSCRQGRCLYSNRGEYISLFPPYFPIYIYHGYEIKILWVNASWNHQKIHWVHWWFSGRILACHAGGPSSTPTLPSTYYVFGTWPGSAAAPPRGRRDTSAQPWGGEEETGRSALVDGSRSKEPARSAPPREGPRMDDNCDLYV